MHAANQPAFSGLMRRLSRCFLSVFELTRVGCRVLWTSQNDWHQVSIKPGAWDGYTYFGVWFREFLRCYALLVQLCASFVFFYVLSWNCDVILIIYVQVYLLINRVTDNQKHISDKIFRLKIETSNIDIWLRSYVVVSKFFLKL